MEGPYSPRKFQQPPSSWNPCKDLAEHAKYKYLFNTCLRKIQPKQVKCSVCATSKPCNLQPSDFDRYVGSDHPEICMGDQPGITSGGSTTLKYDLPGTGIVAQTLHVWHIYSHIEIHWGGFRGQYRHIFHTHGVFG